MREVKFPDKKPTVTTEQLVSAIERLNLHDGSVLIVHDPDLTPRITALRIRSINFPLPIIVAKEGNLTTVEIEDLRKIVQEYDDRNAPEIPEQEATPSAPPAEGW